MYIYTLKKQKFKKKKKFSKGLRDSTEHPTISPLRHKGYRKN